ncbi:MAG: hypothetical protein ACTTIZ_03750 [Treponema sp.]
MKKKLLVVLLPIFIIVTLSSCGGVAVVSLTVSVYPQKEDGTAFKREELNTFSITNTGGKQGTDVGQIFVDRKTGKAYILMEYRLGTAHYEWSRKKLAMSYKDKIQNKSFAFRIEDRAEKYEPFDMNPLTNDYAVIDEEEPHIKYTITLKKKK